MRTGVPPKFYASLLYMFTTIIPKRYTQPIEYALDHNISTRKRKKVTQKVLYSHTSTFDMTNMLSVKSLIRLSKLKSWYDAWDLSPLHLNLMLVFQVGYDIQGLMPFSFPPSKSSSYLFKISPFNQLKERGKGLGFFFFFPK